MTLSKSVKTRAGRSAETPGFPADCRYIVGVIGSRRDFRRALRMRKAPDLFELRLDQLVSCLDELEKNLPGLPAPLILTARDPREGGVNNLSAAERRGLLGRFLPHARYIDVELRSLAALRQPWELARRAGVRRIISFHDLKDTPDSRSLRAKAKAAKAAGADLFKVATRSNTPGQLARLVEFVRNSNAGIPLSVMGIGRLGARSRITLGRSGSILNYAAIGRATIEGQLSIEKLRSALARED